MSEKSAKFQWSFECQQSFDTLKTALTSSPILGYPIPGVDFILDTDASDVGTGAVLSQIQNGQETVIAYFSKSLDKHERSYCVTRKELLAVVQALQAFHSYLYRQPVTVRTDNAAVSWMQNLKNPTGQTARWLQELGTYNLTVVHRSGTQHRNADAMSRHPCTKCLKQQSRNNIDDDDDEELTENPSADVHVTRVVTRSKAAEISGCKPTMGLQSNWAPSELLQEQKLDPSLNFIISALQTSNRPSWQDISEVSHCQNVMAHVGQAQLREGLFDTVMVRRSTVCFRSIDCPFSLKI